MCTMQASELTTGDLGNTVICAAVKSDGCQFSFGMLSSQPGLSSLHFVRSVICSFTQSLLSLSITRVLPHLLTLPTVTQPLPRALTISLTRPHSLIQIEFIFRVLCGALC